MGSTIYRKPKVSFSNGNCVEVGIEAEPKSSVSESGNCLEAASWRKPRRSNPTGCCVEAGTGRQVVGVRDTKQEDLGDDRVVLQFSPDAWRRFTSQVRDGVAWG